MHIIRYILEKNPNRKPFFKFNIATMRTELYYLVLLIYILLFSFILINILLNS